MFLKIFMGVHASRHSSVIVVKHILRFQTRLHQITTKEHLFSEHFQGCMPSDPPLWHVVVAQEFIQLHLTMSVFAKFCYKTAKFASINGFE